MGWFSIACHCGCLRCRGCGRARTRAWGFSPPTGESFHPGLHRGYFALGGSAGRTAVLALESAPAALINTQSSQPSLIACQAPTQFVPPSRGYTAFGKWRLRGKKEKRGLQRRWDTAVPSIPERCPSWRHGYGPHLYTHSPTKIKFSDALQHNPHRPRAAPSFRRPFTICI